MTQGPPVIGTADGIFEIDATGTDPDGGPVAIRVVAVQTPDGSGIRPGAVLARQTDALTFRQGVRLPDAGTWILRIVAEDDEPAPFRGVTDQELTILVDGPPVARIDGPVQVSALETLVLDGRQSRDADSRCDLGPACGHATEDGAPVRGISAGITRYHWELVSATPDDAEAAVDLGPLAELYDVPASAPVAEIALGTLPGGHYLFRLRVTDAEDNEARLDHAVQVIAPRTAPMAIATPPQRIML